MFDAKEKQILEADKSSKSKTAVLRSLKKELKAKLDLKKQQIKQYR